MGLIDFIVDQNRRSNLSDFATNQLPQAFPDANPSQKALIKYAQINPEAVPDVMKQLQEQSALSSLFMPQSPTPQNTPAAAQAPAPTQLESGGALASVAPTTEDIPFDPSTMQVSSLAQYGQPQPQPEPQQTPQSRLAKALPFLPAAAQTAVMNQMMMNGSLGGGAGIGTSGQVPTIDDLRSSKSPVASKALALIEGREAVNGQSMRNPLITQAMTLAEQVDPSFSQATAQTRFQTAKSYAPGSNNGQVLQSIGTASGHLVDLKEAYDKLNNSDYEDLNKVSNWASRKNYLPDKERNKEIQGAIGQFNTALNAVAPELAKVSSGSVQVAEGEINKRRSAFSLDASPEDFNAAMQEAASLIKSRSDSMIENYKQTMGGNLPPTAPKFSSRVLNNFSNLGVPLTDNGMSQDDNATTPAQPQKTGLKAPAKRVIKFSDLK